MDGATVRYLGPVGPDSDARRGPLTSWTGWDVRGGAAAGVDAVETLARLPDVGSGADARYELIAVAARGFRPPQFLRSFELPDKMGAEGQLAEEEWPDRLKPAWSVLYRRVAETAPASVTPYAIYLLGVNPPTDITSAELDVFNDFYTHVHMPEVADRRHALRAERYELVRETRSPYRGAPRFLAVYELDQAAAANRRHVGPPYAAGPDVWQRHTTPWRLWYRRVG